MDVIQYFSYCNHGTPRIISPPVVGDGNDNAKAESDTVLLVRLRRLRYFLRRGFTVCNQLKRLSSIIRRAVAVSRLLRILI